MGGKPRRSRVHRRAQARKDGKHYAWEDDPSAIPEHNDPSQRIVQAIKSSDYMVLVVHCDVPRSPPWTRLVVRRHDGRKIGRTRGAITVARRVASDLAPGRLHVINLDECDETVVVILVPPDSFVWPLA